MRSESRDLALALHARGLQPRQPTSERSEDCHPERRRMPESREPYEIQLVTRPRASSAEEFDRINFESPFS